MRRFSLVLAILLLMGHSSATLAASKKATALRQANGLTVCTPPEKFLAANFVADEMNPGFVFGPVKAFVASRPNPTAWLIEACDQDRQATTGSTGQPLEYTLYLEEDVPGGVVYYVFIDQSNLTPQQWIEWRRQFHKSKTDEQFGPVQAKLEQAFQQGVGVGAELRFLQKNGELVPQGPEAILRQALKFPPLYDLTRQQKIGQ
jgi:hypothetical protein